MDNLSFESEDDSQADNPTTAPPIANNTNNDNQIDLGTQNTTTAQPKPTYNFSKTSMTPKIFNDFSFDQTFGPNVPIDISSPCKIFLLIIGSFLHVL